MLDGRHKAIWPQGRSRGGGEVCTILTGLHQKFFSMNSSKLLKKTSISKAAFIVILLIIYLNLLSYVNVILIYIYLSIVYMGILLEMYLW